MKKLIIVDDNDRDPEGLNRLLRENGFAATEIVDLAGEPESWALKSARMSMDLLENAPIGIFRSTLEGKFKNVNTAFARMLKFDSPEELIRQVNGTDIADALYAAPERRQEIIRHVLSHDVWSSFEERLRCRDGTIITCDLQIHAVPGDNGCGELQGFIADISERKRTEETQRLSQFIIDNAAIGIFRGNDDGRILYTNEHGAKALGYTREELCSMSFFDINPNLTQQWWREHREKLRSIGSKTFESAHRRKDGTQFPVEITASYLKFGDTVITVSFAQDITVLKQAEEELKLTAFSVDNISDAVQWITADTRFWNVNRAACEMLGYSREEMLTMTISDIDPYFALESWQAHLEEIRDTGSIYLPNRFHRTKDGRIIPVEITTNYLNYKGIDYYCAVVRDISQRVMAEREASLFRALIEHTRDPVYVLDPADGGRMLYVNQAACLHYGKSLEELQNMRIPDWDPEFDMETMEPNLQKMKKGKPLRFETMHRVASGDLVPVEVTANYLEHDGRELVAGYFHDISKRKRMQDEQLRTQKLESLGVLAGGIAHDFNNLLTGIMGNLSLIRVLLPDDNKAQERIDRCEKAVKEATGLTCQLLTFSRGGDPVKKVIDLSRVVRDALTFVLRGSNVAGKLMIAEDLWPIEADEGQIGQVINNLLINADQSMLKGGVVRVDLDNCSLEKNQIPSLKPGPYIRISVADQGCGIPPENLNRIFDPYFTTKETGTGLGLTSLYSIVKKHRGEVVVTSRLDEGTLFQVYLPASPECEIEEDFPEPYPSPTGEGGYVIVMDDEENIRELAGEMLSYLGYRFILCSCGEEVVAVYRDEMERGVRPDAVIMDLIVPGKMGGLEAATMIMAMDPPARIIVSSGYSNDPVMANFESFGFSEALLKPFMLEDMSAVMGKIEAKNVTIERFPKNSKAG